MGKHTKVTQVYRHWKVRKLSTTVTGMATALPTAPTQPRHSRRQRDTLPGLVIANWVLSWMSATAVLLLTAMHSLTLTTITDTDTMHWHRECNHMNSMSEEIKNKN